MIKPIYLVVLFMCILFAGTEAVRPGQPPSCDDTTPAETKVVLDAVIKNVLTDPSLEELRQDYSPHQPRHFVLVKGAISLLRLKAGVLSQG